MAEQSLTPSGQDTPDTFLRASGIASAERRTLEQFRERFISEGEVDE